MSRSTSHRPIRRDKHTGMSLGVTMVLSLALAIIIAGILRLATFNAQTTVGTVSLTEHSKSASALLEFSAAQLAAKLSAMTDFNSESPSKAALDFKFLPPSNLFVGGTTAIGQGKVDTANTFCDVCKWPESDVYKKFKVLTFDAKQVEVNLTGGPQDLLNTRLNVVSNDYNRKDPIIGASYSNSAYIPLRCRIAGQPDAKGNTHDVYATAVLWMREANLFRHALYVNDLVYYVGAGGTEAWEGSIFSNKPMVFNLSAGTSDYPINSSATGFYQFERVACPQFFVCDPGTYVNYATSGKMNALTGAFNPPTANMKTSVSNLNTHAVWMGRGDLNGDGNWSAFTKGISGNAALNPTTTESRPLYVTLADINGYADPDNFWKPATKNDMNDGNLVTNKNGYITLDSFNPEYLRTYASKFNGAFVTNENGFTASLPDGIPPTAAPLARALIEPPSPAKPGMPELPRPDGKAASDPLDPSTRKTNPGLYDQWAAYLALSGTSTGYNPTAQDLQAAESLKYSNKAGIYIYVDTEGNTTAFTASENFDTPAKAAAAYKAADKKAEWKETNKSSIINLPTGVIATTNVFLDDTNIDRTKNGTSYNGSVDKNINSTENSIAGNGDITAIMDQARLVRAVDINFGALRSAVRNSKAITNGSGETWNPANNWTGIMYVDVANPVAATTTTSTWGKSLNTIKTSIAYTGSGDTPITGKTYDGASLDTAFNAVMHQTAVRIYNATQIPDMTGVAGVTAPTGFTLATNAAAYSVGSVNADTDTTTYPKNATAGKQENNNVKTSADAVSLKDSSYHIPFGLVCDNYTWISPAYQDNLNPDAIPHTDEGYTIPKNAISLDADKNNLVDYGPDNTASNKPKNVTDAKGLAFGDLATLFNIKLDASGKFTSSTSTPKKVDRNNSAFKTAASIELNIALIAGGGDVQSQTKMHAEPLHVFNLDNNALVTNLFFSGSQVALFKSQYRPKYNRDALSSCYPQKNSTRYDPNFARGYVPPGSPYTRVYRLTGFRIISRAEFDSMAR